MAKDLMFRTTAFGGFKKDDVMDFFEKILSEKSSLEKQVAANSANTSELNAQIASLQSEVADISKLRSDVANLTAQINDYEALVGSKEASIDELENKLRDLESAADDKDTLIKELTERLSKAEASVVDNGEVELLKRENERLQMELNKKNAMERQVGAAMLDARVHSEELVEQAKERANIVTKAVYAAIGDTAVRIDDLSAGIGEIARNFTKSVEEVELRIKALTGDMSKTAQALISENVLSDEIGTEVIDIPNEYNFSVSARDDSASFESNIGDEDY